MASGQVSSDVRTAADKTCRFVIFRAYGTENVRIAVTACMSVNYCLSQGDTTPGLGSGMGCLSTRAGNRTVNYCLSVETPLSAKLTSPLSGEKLFIAKLINIFLP